MEFIPHVIYDMIYSTFAAILPKVVIDSVIIFLNKILWTPILLVETFTLMVTFWISLVLRYFNFIHVIEKLNDSIDRLVLTRYTMVTRRIHIPKHKAPKQFTPSISFMGGKYNDLFCVSFMSLLYNLYAWFRWSIMDVCYRGWSLCL